MNLENNILLLNDDCLNAMKNIPDNSVDLILCDLPYGITKMEWDNKIPFDKLWEQYNRIISDKGNILLFASGKFVFELYESNPLNYRYRLIWKKNVPVGMSYAKYRPMHYYEDILIFNNGVNSIYNPIKKERVGVGKACYKYEHYCGNNNHINVEKKKYKYDPDYVNPSDVLEFNVVPNRNGKFHPTQKPVELLEYLIKMYSNEDSIVLDNTMGSGSTGVAAINCNRKFIGIELDKDFFYIAYNRINDINKLP